MIDTKKRKIIQTFNIFFIVHFIGSEVDTTKVSCSEFMFLINSMVANLSNALTGSPEKYLSVTTFCAFKNRQSDTYADP